jgi:putative spermidine/putrescine transport system ATP-binding protein
MDEPLGALDRKLRETLQLEIARISRQIGVTVIYVTHDQEEALTLSDRIAVYNHGRIEQIGTGEDLYERPVSLFVASFLGDASILRGKLAGTHQAVEVATPQGLIHVVPEAARRVNLGPGDDVALVLRPERVQVYPRGVDACAGESDANVIDGMLTEVIYLGPIRKYLVETPGKQVIQARSQGGQVDDLVPGTAVHVKWRIADSVVVPQ